MMRSIWYIAQPTLVVLQCCGVFFVSVDSEDLNGELDDVGQPSKNGLISNEFQQALSTHFDSTSHRDNNKDIGKSHTIALMLHKCW